MQGDAERAARLLHQARTHQADLPRADVLTARITELAADPAGALTLYLKALEESPELALEIIPRVLGSGAMPVGPAGGDRGAAAPQRHDQLRQLAWLLATALPPHEVRRLPDIAGEAGSETGSAADARSLGALLTRIGDTGGRYQCDDCGLLSVGWYWRCPKCRSWDSMRPAVFKWAEKTRGKGVFLTRHVLCEPTDTVHLATNSDSPGEFR